MMSSNKFTSLNDNEQDQVLTEAVIKAYRNAGKTIDPRFYNETISTIKEIIRRYYPKIKVTTVSSVFERGSLGMLGDYYGLTPKTFNSWLTVGYRDEHHKRDSDIEQPTRPSTEGDTISLLDLLAELLGIKQNLAFDGTKEYNYLRYKDLIQYGKSDEFLKEAEQTATTTAIMEKRGEKVRVIDGIKNIQVEDIEAQEIAKKLAVEDWLRTIYGQGKKPSEVITSTMSQREWTENGFHLPSKQYRNFIAKKVNELRANH